MAKAFRCWVCARLREASTWAGMGTVFAGAVAVPHPWVYGVVVCGIAAIMLRGGSGDDAA